MSKIPKDLTFEEEGTKRLQQGVIALANAVKITMGPAGQTVIIETLTEVGGKIVTKDGVSVAKEVELSDPVSNLAVEIVREAAKKTATSDGDGTTTSIVLAEALISNGVALITPEMNKTEVLRFLDEHTKEVLRRLENIKVDVTPENLKHVASISANNDELIGGTVTDLYDKVGPDGVVFPAKSMTPNTYTDYAKGIKLKRGYADEGFINNEKGDECILEDNVKVLITDIEINNLMSLEKILGEFTKGPNKLLIVGPSSSNFTQLLVLNTNKGKIRSCIVPAPDFGYRQGELMNDMAIALGGNFLSQKEGDNFENLTWEDLGSASKIVAGKDTTIILPEIQDTEEVSDKIEQLKEAYERENDEYAKEFIKTRIANLAGGVATLYVGGQTELEQKELYDRVEDSILAVKSALKNGVIPGGGLALHDVGKAMLIDNLTEDVQLESDIALKILCQSLPVPLFTILANAELKYGNIYNENTLAAKNKGYNVKTKEYGDMFEMGVIDPMSVTTSALTNAVSVTKTILSTGCVISLKRQ